MARNFKQLLNRDEGIDQLAIKKDFQYKNLSIKYQEAILPPLALLHEEDTQHPASTIFPGAHLETYVPEVAPGTGFTGFRTVKLRNIPKTANPAG